VSNAAVRGDNYTEGCLGQTGECCFTWIPPYALLLPSATLRLSAKSCDNCWIHLLFFLNPC